MQLDLFVWFFSRMIFIWWNFERLYHGFSPPPWRCPWSSVGQRRMAIPEVLLDDIRGDKDSDNKDYDNYKIIMAVINLVSSVFLPRVTTFLVSHFPSESWTSSPKIWKDQVGIHKLSTFLDNPKCCLAKFSKFITDFHTAMVIFENYKSPPCF